MQPFEHEATVEKVRTEVGLEQSGAGVAGHVTMQSISDEQPRSDTVATSVRVTCFMPTKTQCGSLQCKRNDHDLRQLKRLGEHE